MTNSFSVLLPSVEESVRNEQFENNSSIYSSFCMVSWV